MMVLCDGTLSTLPKASYPTNHLPPTNREPEAAEPTGRERKACEVGETDNGPLFSEENDDGEGEANALSRLHRSGSTPPSRP